MTKCLAKSKLFSNFAPDLITNINVTIKKSHINTPSGAREMARNPQTSKHEKAGGKFSDMAINWLKSFWNWLNSLPPSPISLGLSLLCPPEQLELEEHWRKQREFNKKLEESNGEK